jgi:hypothetical protein
MDIFKIILIIFMIIVIYQFYLLNCNSINEPFSNADQSIGGVDDQNSINTLAQLARKLMDGGATIPGNLNFKGTTMPLSILSGTASPDAYKFQFGDGTGWRLRFQKDDKTPTMDIYDNGNVTVAGNLNVQGTTTVPILNLGNKFRLSGTGDAHGNDDWIRLFGVDNKGYYGGIAMNKCHIQTSDFLVAGRNILAEIDAIKARLGNLSGVRIGRWSLNDEGVAFTIRDTACGGDCRWALFNGRSGNV